MMVAVDALSRRYGILPDQHIKISSILSLCDKEQQQVAYTHDFSIMPDATNISASADAPSSVIPILSISAIYDRHAL